MKTALVLGGGGFIGHNMVNRLKDEGYWVRSVDLKSPQFEATKADHFVIRDLRDMNNVDEIIGFAGSCRNPYQTWDRQFDLPFDEVYIYASLMGGMGFIGDTSNDAAIMQNSISITLNVMEALAKRGDKPKVFFASSACIYNQQFQNDPLYNALHEYMAYPAFPDTEYGWAKLIDERICFAYSRCHGIPVRVGRFHNIYGPNGVFDGGKEKAPAAICRKVILAKDNIEIWGDGDQSRSFLYIDDCLDATRSFMESDFEGPLNIGSEELVTINQLVDIAASFESKELTKVYDPTKPQGVRGRNSDNTLIYKTLGWKPKYTLNEGLEKTYWWIAARLAMEDVG